ncbi:hypothetical protein [Streptomyces spinoverrucosus]|uniref:hypothetical protein n=1 Tax=Streptomyces spinoverrucosus TaxID=284043 RepID=UPI001E36ECA6|nr:hypothetical protein [Streptomyces spinoverrucosus]
MAANITGADYVIDGDTVKTVRAPPTRCRRPPSGYAVRTPKIWSTPCSEAVTG